MSDSPAVIIYNSLREEIIATKNLRAKYELLKYSFLIGIFALPILIVRLWSSNNDSASDFSKYQDYFLWVPLLMAFLSLIFDHASLRCSNQIKRAGVYLKQYIEPHLREQHLKEPTNSLFTWEEYMGLTEFRPKDAKEIMFSYADLGVTLFFFMATFIAIVYTVTNFIFFSNNPYCNEWLTIAALALFLGIYVVTHIAIVQKLKDSTYHWFIDVFIFTAVALVLCIPIAGEQFNLNSWSHLASSVSFALLYTLFTRSLLNLISKSVLVGKTGITEKPNLRVIGGNGQWVSQMIDNLRSRFNIYLEDFNYPKSSDKVINEADVLIATPPNTHLQITKETIDTFAESPTKNRNILIEKPFPNIAILAEETEPDDALNNVYIVDHYLAKSGVKNLFSLLKHQLTKTPISTKMEVAIAIRESKTESRDWMKQDDQYGGVIYDLGHHAVAIVYKINCLLKEMYPDHPQFASVNQNLWQPTIEINHAKQLAGSLVCGDIHFKLHVSELLSADITLAKAAEDQKEIIIKQFSAKTLTQHVLPLNGKVDYAKMLEKHAYAKETADENTKTNISALLNVHEAMHIDDTLQKINDQFKDTYW